MTEGSLETDSRNGVGKTSLLQVLDFCLAGSVRENHVLLKLADEGWTFTLAVDMGDHELSFTRDVDDPTHISVSGDLEPAGLLDKPGVTSRDFTIGQFKAYLGQRVLGLPEDGVPYAPTLRSVVTHSMRWRGDAFNSPFEAFGREKTVQVQVNNALLLGLDWRLAAERQALKDRGTKLGRVGKEEVDEAGRKLAELDAEHILLVEQAGRLEDQLASFTVLPEYREIERRTNRLTRNLQDLANQSTLVARQLELYEEELDDQRTLSIDQVRDLYAEAEVFLGENVTRSLGEVEAFHRQITRNRRAYLAAEVRRLYADQESREETMHLVDLERSRDLELLSSSGALDELSQLQGRLAEANTHIRLITNRREELRSLRAGKAALRREELEWQERASLDLDERRAVLTPVVQDFAGFFRRLYDEDGILIVDVTSNGYAFNVRLPRQGSHGVSKMAVFAYDLAIAVGRDRPSLGVVAHDSLIFDGVDERQIAKALAYAAERVESADLQYLVTVNTDDLPSQDLLPRNVDVEASTILTLTDQDAAGCLFGVRFA